MKTPYPQMRRFCRWLCSAFALAAISQLAPRAHAALGEDVTSIATDQARMQAKLQVLPKGNYVVHELQVPTGATVREFVGDSGKVFAVSWSVAGVRTCAISWVPTMTAMSPVRAGGGLHADPCASNCRA